jgi:hypothetical protein
LRLIAESVIPIRLSAVLSLMVSPPPPPSSST